MVQASLADKLPRPEQVVARACDLAEAAGQTEVRWGSSEGTTVLVPRDAHGAWEELPVTAPWVAGLAGTRPDCD